MIGEAPHTGNNIVMATDGDCAGQVFEFDHDSLRFTQKGNNIVAYVERLLDLDTETLTEIAAPMRLTDKIYGVQWSIAEMRDNRGNHVRVRL